MGECFIQQGYTAGVPAGEARFTVSGTWTSPFNGYVSLFLVNGGNGGGHGKARIGYIYQDYGEGGEGGNGGSTATFINVPVVKGEVYEISVGRGGDGGDSSEPYTRVAGACGGTSCFSDSLGINVYCPEDQKDNGLGRGGIVDSGSGSGGGLYAYGYNVNGSSERYAESGFTNGTNGQNRTTKEFGNEYGILYSGGGGGGGCSVYDGNMNGVVRNAGSGGTRGGGSGGTYGIDAGANATANTGGGGGGGGSTTIGVGYLYLDGVAQAARGGNGGSGMVIIKWHANGARTIDV